MVMALIPQQFMNVRYDGSRFPGAPGVSGVAEGANCQQFAYELLRHFGYSVPDLRSSELWEDTDYTYRAGSLEPFDLLLFSADGKAFGAHVGVYLGEEKVIHLSKEAGFPEIRELAWFQNTPRYCTLLGAKRCRVRHATQDGR
ncbi:MAG TPA: NlpC/P60 family protein [Blastocatellia bacterium]|nr:NlpC/P60 family protein [Blastocatellia bacterium]